MKKLRLLLGIFLTLFVFWMLFTLDFCINGIILGVFTSLLITIFSFYVIYDHSGFSFRIPNLFTFIHYSFRLIYEIYRASFIQILRIIKQDNHSVIIEVKLDVTDPLLITIIANSITLTPGTITIDTDDNILFVLSIKDDGEDGEQIKQSIKNRFEKYFLKKG